MTVSTSSFARMNFFRDVAAMEQVCMDATEAKRSTVENVKARAEQLVASSTALLAAFDDPNMNITPTPEG